ncbi:hypothetical protein [Thermodesulforhabdus norvegica]|uniref:DUF1640 domain-containing protein n=1 Tax=Thermodesulforhabdus norvegica TaxID=39841 RepID=A0A1I4TS96_9BACT|nr:hypothetical protein [Thermodesulforhabdus norvegica]SFM79413.1 hypothetical protein SAMN05660836_01482 [Thermodesulforhabdus norvegica]
MPSQISNNEQFYQKVAELVRKILHEEAENLFAEKIADFVRNNELKAKELSLIERVIRVEEELKSLRVIETERFEVTEKRFEALQRELDARLSALHNEVNARFEAVDKRLEALHREMNTRFEALHREMNARFEATERRFEVLQREMNTRFEAMERRFTMLQWTMGIGFSFLAVLIAVIKF